MDVESTERPLSSASTSSQKMDRGGPPIIPAMPEVKRGRGRPRKNRDNLEEGKWLQIYVFFYFSLTFSMCVMCICMVNVYVINLHCVI